MPTIFKQIMADGGLMDLAVGGFSYKTCIGKNPADRHQASWWMTRFVICLFALNLNVVNGKEDYHWLGSKIIFLVKRKLRLPFSFVTITVDTRTTISDDPGVKTVRQVGTQIALAVVQDDFEITAAVTAPNALNSHSC